MGGRLELRARVFPRAVWQRARRPRARPGALRRVLVAHHLLLGDTIMVTPLLAKLRAMHPDAEIVVTVPRPWAPLYGARPYGLRAVAWDPREAASLDPILRAPGFDCAYVPGDNRYSWVALAAGARWIVAFAGDRPAYKSWPVDELVAYPGAPAAWGDMVAGLAPGPEPAPYVAGDWPAPPFEPFDRPAGRYAVLHVGASSPLKQWLPERWAALAEALAARGLAVVWSAGRGEEGLVRACDPQGRHASVAGRLDAAQLWHLVAGACLLASPDTGVAHLARLTGTPTLTLYGPGSATVTGPGRFWRDHPHRAMIVDPFPCRDQRVLFKREIAWVLRCGRSTAQCPRPRCLEAVDVANVVEAADALLRSGRSGRTEAAPH